MIRIEFILCIVLLHCHILNGQIIRTVAGNGNSGYSADGGPADSTGMFPWGTAVDAQGNLYIADAGNNRIRKVNASTGIITTVAGNGIAGYNGDGGPADSAGLNGPRAVAMDASGNIYIGDTWNNVIRKVSAATGIITTIAGNFWEADSGYGGGFSGDGGPADSALLSFPQSIALDASGNIYIGDYENNRMRKINASTGIITTIVGNGQSGYLGDGGPADSAEISAPWGVALDDSGNVYIADAFNNVIRKVYAATGIITTIAGNGIQGYSGDGGPADSAEMDGGTGMAVDDSGNVYIADAFNNVVRKVSIATGIISNFAGNSQTGFSGDGGPAYLAELNEPMSISMDAVGNVYISDYVNFRIRKVYSNTNCTPQVTITASADTVCPGSSVTFIATPVNGGNAPVYQWQLNGSDWGNNSDTFIVPSISNGSVISCILTSNAVCDSGVTATSNTITITVISLPAIINITASPNPVCAGDPVQLQANTAPFCGIGLPTYGNAFSVVGSGTIVQPGDGVTFPTVLGNYDHSYRQQILYTSTELSAALGGAQAILQISFNIPSYNSNAYLNITIRMGCTGLDSLTAWQNGLSEVAVIPNMQPHGGWNSLTLSSPFYWDGISNLIIDVCIYDPVTYGNQNNKAQCTNTAFNSYIYQESDIVDLCDTDITPFVSTLRPNIWFGTGPPVYSSYTYNWQPATGATAVSDSAISNPTAIPTQPTTYYLTIADTFGCRYTDSVSVGISASTLIPTIAITGDSNACPGASVTYSAVITNGGNNPGYQWKINGVNTGTNSSSFTHDGFNNGDTITCVLTSSSACASPATGISNNIIITVDTAPAAPIITEIADTLLSNSSTGNQWYFNGQSISGGTNPVYLPVQSGSYYDLVSNSYGCNTLSNHITYNVLQVVINASNYACNNQPTGQAIAVASGGSSYTYHWNTGATTSAIDSLPAGTYSVTVTSNNGQTATASTTINQDLFDFGVTVLQPVCDVIAYGSAEAGITFGSGTFYYYWSNGDTSSWITNLAPGNYSLTVTDANGCTLSDNFQIITDTLLIVNMSSTGSTGSNGTATALVVQGAPPYSYMWSDSDTTNTITSLQPGVYTVTITDMQGCSYTASDTVQNLTGIMATPNPTPTINIFPNPTDGQLTVVLTGNGYMSIRLLDELGQEVYTQPLIADEQQQNLQINLNNVANGVYILQVVTQSGNINKRVVVQK